MIEKTGALVLMVGALASYATAQDTLTQPVHGKRAQGAIVIHNGAKVYESKSSMEVTHTFKRGEAVAGWHREALFIVYEFDEQNGREQVRYPNRDSSKPSTGWMDPEDLSTFTYDCGCEVQCVPFRSSFGPAKWNPCFEEARDEKLDKLRERWEREDTRRKP